jgi:hypothetical protein
MNSRITVNNLQIIYNEETDELIFQKNGLQLKLRMGEDKLNLLYQMTPYPKYKRYLLATQNFSCFQCGKNLKGLPANQYALHHDPPLGNKGARYIDFKNQSRNRMLCKDCHKQSHKL